MKEQSGNLPARFSTLKTKNSVQWGGPACPTVSLLMLAQSGEVGRSCLDTCCQDSVAVTVCYPSSRTVRIAWVHAHSVHRHGLHVQEWHALRPSC